MEQSTSLFGSLRDPGERYHGDLSQVSHSALEVFRKSIPRFEAIYITKTLPYVPSPEMEVGTALHMLVLEPEKFAARVVIAAEKFDRRTTIGKMAYQQFHAAHAGKTIIAPEDGQMIVAMANSLKETPATAAWLSQSGQAERTLTWRHPSTGLALKCRIDKLLLTTDGIPVALDVKTTGDADLEGFGRACANFGYHRQAALYIDGMKHALPVMRSKRPSFVFLVVSKQFPHECRAVELDELSLRLGHDQNERSLAELADRMKREDKRWQSRYHEQTGVIELPKYAFYET